MNRRKFLQIAGLTSGGLVASATMAEAGVFAEIASWLKRQPVWSIPKNVTLANIAQYSDYASSHDLSLAAAIDPAVEICAKELAYRAAVTINTIAADDLLPELSLRNMSTIYYDKKALDNLNNAVAIWAKNETIPSLGRRIDLDNGKCQHVRIDQTSTIAWAVQSDGVTRGVCQRCIDVFTPSHPEYSGLLTKPYNRQVVYSAA